MNATEFRTSFLRLTEPITVSDGKSKRVIGVWYPGGHECPADAVVQMGVHAPAAMEAARAKIEEQAEEIARLKRQLAERATRLSTLEDRAVMAESGIRPAPTLDDDLAVREAHRLAEQAKARAEFEAESERRRAWQRRMVTPQKGRGE
jgi:hypothetical protein